MFRNKKSAKYGLTIEKAFSRTPKPLPTKKNIFSNHRYKPCFYVVILLSETYKVNPLC